MLALSPVPVVPLTPWVQPELGAIMKISIDLEDTEPLFAQLVSQIKLAVKSDYIVPGAPLPSIRQLAGDLDLNNKTVAKAYRLLERDGVVQSKGYRGTFVHPQAKENCDVDLGQWVQAKFNDVVSELRRSGATDSEIRNAFTTVMNNH